MNYEVVDGITTKTSLKRVNALFNAYNKYQSDDIYPDQHSFYIGKYEDVNCGLLRRVKHLMEKYKFH